MAKLAALVSRVGGTPIAAESWWGSCAAAGPGPHVDAAGVAAAWRVAPAELALEAEGAAISGLEAAVLLRVGCGAEVSW
jgi:hypothetical protein